MDSKLWQLSDSEVEAQWQDGIADLFPQFDPDSVNWVQTARNPRTAPIYERGYLEMVVPYDLSDAVAEGVYYAGMASRAQYPERSLNGAIEAGMACADRIQRSFDRRENEDGPSVADGTLSRTSRSRNRSSDRDRP
jgi:protoporphyrinogen oxidase